MRRLHGHYALLFNRRHRKVGHVFQGRFGSKLMRSDEQLWTTARYIQRNPVDAGPLPDGGRVALEQPPRDGRGNGPILDRRAAAAGAFRDDGR